MNLQKYTQKSIDAIQNTQNIASEYQNPQIEQQHLVYALLTQQEGLIPQLLIQIGININGIVNRVQEEISKLPHVWSQGIRSRRRPGQQERSQQGQQCQEE